MVTTATSSFGFRRSLVRCAYGLALALAIIAAALLALGADRLARRMVAAARLVLHLDAMGGLFGDCRPVLAVLALLLGRAAVGRRGVAIGAAAFVVGALIAYFPLHYNALRGKYPPIDDITTDTADPPAFAAAVALRQAEGDNPTTYQGAKIAAQQQRAYPDIAPLQLAMPPAQAFSQALDTARHMGWTVLADDPAAGRIEATDKQPMVRLYRRYRHPGHRLGQRQPHRHALFVAARAQRFRGQRRAHPRLHGGAAQSGGRSRLVEQF